MQRHPARYTHTDTLFPYTTLCRSLLGLAGAASAAPAGNRRLALVDRVPPRPDQRDRDRGEQEHALQFQRPATLVIELADLAHLRQAEGEQHVDRDDTGPVPPGQAEPPHKPRPPPTHPRPPR